MALPDKLQVDQALFGYSDGHRQLASSVGLPSKDLYELATRSDLSPGASLSGSRSYISGFALSDTRIFALIKTWPAPEMPRPGCVWSHVLLLSRSFLTTQVNLGVLKDLFRRPDGRSDVDRYKQTLSVRRLAKSPPSSREIVADIIASYYQNELVLLEDTPNEAFERAMFDVWSQQWPRLRSEFSFRTVQSAEPIREKGLTIKISSHPASSGQTRPIRTALPWVAAAVEDATSSTITSLRRFLWRYGKDVAAPRRSFRALVEIHETASRRRSGATFFIAEQVLASFPKSTDALTLKRDLLGVSPPALALIPKMRPADMPRLLSSWSAVDNGVIQDDELRSVVAALDQDDLVAMAGALAALEEQPSREVEIATDALVAALDADVIKAAGLPAPVVLKVLRRRPKLLETFDLSGIEASDVIDLIDVAEHPMGVTNILSRILSSPPNLDASAAVERHAELAFGEAIRSALANRLHPDWRQMFKRLVDKILPGGLRMFAGGPKQAAQGLWLLDFPLNGSPPAADWLEAVGDAPEDDLSSERSTVDAYLLALCLRDGVAKTIPILVKTLPRLRLMAVNGILSLDAQKLLDRRLPSISDYWDLNKRMLKILRKANRNGVNIDLIISKLSLTSEELDYVFEQDDEKSYTFALTRYLWPWI